MEIVLFFACTMTAICLAGSYPWWPLLVIAVWPPLCAISYRSARRI